MCWVAVAPFTFAVLCKGGFVGYGLQAVGRSDPLSCPSTIWFQSSACVSCLLIERIEVSLALVYAGSDMRLQVRLLDSVNF
jgi:hypothetical protein